MVRESDAERGQQIIDTSQYVKYLTNSVIIAVARPFSDFRRPVRLRLQPFPQRER
jgi:hypothetical protein